MNEWRMFEVLYDLATTRSLYLAWVDHAFRLAA